MIAGYTDTILRIDLSTRRVTTEHPGEGFFRSLFGGWGPDRPCAVGVERRRLRSVRSGEPPRLRVGCGHRRPRPGKRAPRGWCAISADRGDSERADVGGFWGPELKQAGYDAVVIVGKAESPVYLWIHDGPCRHSGCDTPLGTRDGEGRGGDPRGSLEIRRFGSRSAASRERISFAMPA